MVLSINYDTRFSQSNKGLGLRIGIDNLLGIAVPVSINYLIGNNNKRSFLEIGTGGTLYKSNNTYHLSEKNLIILVTYIMYRFQEIINTVVFRAGITQLKLSDENISSLRFYTPGISFGVKLGK